MENDAVIVSSLGKFSKVLACLLFEISLTRPPLDIAHWCEPYSWRVFPVEFELDISETGFENDGVHGRVGSGGGGYDCHGLSRWW